MNKTLIAALLLLSLAACTEKPGSSEKQTASLSPNSIANPPLLKLSTERPAGIPSMLAATDGACSLDAANDQPVQETSKVAEKARLKLAGWAGNVATGSVPQERYLEFGGAKNYYAKVMIGQKRPDVASFFNKPGLADAGWESLADATDLPAGGYRIRIIQIEGASGAICDTKRTLVFK